MPLGNLLNIREGEMTFRLLTAFLAIASLAFASQAMAQSGGLDDTPNTQINPMFNPKEYVIHRKQGQQPANPQRSNLNSSKSDVGKDRSTNPGGPRGKATGKKDDTPSALGRGWWGKGSDAPGRKKDESAMPAIQNTK
jgi:hypothetical protein